MRKLVFAFFVALMFSTTAMAIDIAISTNANWWSQDVANVEMQQVADAVTDATVQQFTADDEAALADWVAAHTGDGVPDLLILTGKFPDSIYPGGNAQPDDSLAELFLDDGNTIINTGDWIFYVNSAGTNNAEGGLQNMMDLPGIAMWGDGTPCVVTSEGQGITPSLQDVPSTRPFFLDQVTGDWSPELILAQSEDGTVADPVILVNSVTGGRVGIIIQVADTFADIRGDVISEWINNWYLPTLGDPTLPGAPEPSNYSVEVLRDVVLTWSAGEGAVSHDVYFGTDETAVAGATRDDSMGVLVSQGQAETTMDLGTLAFGTTYYWRVDQVQADESIVAGPVWSFTTELLAYPIVGVTATSNGTSEEANGPENTVNGSGLTDGLHSADTADMWLCTPDPNAPTYIQFDLGMLYSVYDMMVWNHNSGFEVALGFGIKNATVEYSANGTDWTLLEDVVLNQAPGTPDYAANTVINFGGAAAQYVRITVVDSYMPTGQFGLSEVAFTSIPVFATNPQPEWDADDVSVDVVLSWLAGRGAVAHEIYLSDDEVAVTDGIAYVDTVTDSSYDAGDLDLNKGTTYYWKVNEVTAGDVVFMEDFEAYEAGSDLHGQGGWKGWYNTASAGALATDGDDPVGAGAVEILGSSDLVHEFAVDGGMVEFTAMQYIPSGTTGTQYFILLSAYDDAGADMEWTVQTTFNLETGEITSYGGTTGVATIVYDQWVPVKCVIDLDNNTIEDYYNGVLLESRAWSASGKTTLGAIDLYGAEASSIYYDDITIQSLVGDVWEGDVWTFKTEGQFLGLVDVTTPGDVVLGVPNDDNWPEGELPAYALDDDITTKFLHFGGAGGGITGIQVTPSVGPSIVTGLSFTTANDAPERDPVAYEVYGSNESIDGPYELIAAGEITDFAQEEAWPRFKDNSTDIVFENTVMYDHYQVLLTAVRDAGSANSMQIAEIELLGTPPTDVSSPADPVVGIPDDGDWPDGEYPALATDDDVNTKFLHFKGGSEPTGIQITVPAPSMVTGLAFTTANDSPGRDPIAYELYASTDGVTYEMIASGEIVDFAGEVEWPRFTKNATPIVIANRAEYRHYQVIFPVVRDPGQGLMQIAEVELLGFAEEALDVTTVGDAVLGVPNDGDWPDAEYPDLAIDDDIETKFLHFKGGSVTTGIQVTPVAPSRIIGLALTTANDAAGRDPVSYEIYGSNESIDGPYELIASGDVADFAQEAEWPRFTPNETPISFANEAVYTHYQVLFPAVRDPGQGLMQIGEIELLGFFE